MSSLNALTVEHEEKPYANRLDMSVTRLVSHVEMSPYVFVALVESLHHAPIAVSNSVLSDIG